MITQCSMLCRQAMALWAREWFVYRRRLVRLLTNFLVVSPLSFSGVQGYIKPLMYFGYPLGRKAAMVFAGAYLMYFTHRCFSFATSFFFDIQKEHQVQMQTQWMPLWLVYGVRLTFSTVLSWILLLPLFPVSKLILRHHMYTIDTSWVQLTLVMLLVSLMMNTYAFMCVSAVETLYGISKIRVRLNEILMWLGGFNATWGAMYKSAAIWGILGLCNPFTYGTEALRRAIIPGSDILPYAITIPGLLLWSLLFSLLGYAFLTRRVWNGRFKTSTAHQTQPSYE